MVPECPPDPKKEQFWVILGSILGVFWCVFCIRFYSKRNAFVQGCGVFSSFFDCRLSAVFLTSLIFVVFYLVYAYSVDVVEAAPSGAAEDHRSC